MDRRSLAFSVMLPDNWAENMVPDDATKSCSKCCSKFSLLNRRVKNPYIYLQQFVLTLLCSIIVDFVVKYFVKNAQTQE